MQQDTTGELKEVSIEAVITRADGTVENLGTVSVWRSADEPDESVRRRLTALADGLVHGRLGALTRRKLED